MNGILREARARVRRQLAPPPMRYGLAVLAVILILVLRLSLQPLLGYEAPLLPFTLAVLIAARYGGRGPGLLATALSVALGITFFVVPDPAPDARRTSDAVLIFLFVLTCVSISVLTGALRQAREQAWRSAQAERQSAEHFRLLVAGVRDYAIFLLDPEGRIATWNEGAERIQGYTAGEILGQHISRFYSGEDVAAGEPERALARANAEGRVEEEAWRARKDGSRFLAHAVLTAIRDESGDLRGFAQVTHDITERQRREEEMRYLMAHARCLLWHGTAVEQETPPHGLDWDIQVFDEAVAQEFLPLELLPGERYTDAWYRHRLPEGKQISDATAAQALREGHAEYRTEFGCRDRHGQIRWFADQTHVERLGPRRWRLVGICTDITERKRAEAELQSAFERERQVSASLQRSLLLAPPEDAFPGLAVATFYEAAWEEASVGGDFFDVFPLEEGAVALVVGDISGKGVTAATRTAEVKYALRAYLSEYRHPGRALERLNDFLYDASRTGREAVPTFAALSLAVVEPVSGAITVSVAGAEPPSVLRAAGGIESADPEQSGFPLGVEPGGKYAVTALRIAPGDTLLMMTDGIIEARREGRFFGYEGVERTARAAAATDSLRRLGQSVLDAARSFSGGALQDDVCLLLVRLRDRDAP